MATPQIKIISVQRSTRTVVFEMPDADKTQITIRKISRRINTKDELMGYIMGLSKVQRFLKKREGDALPPFIDGTKAGDLIDLALPVVPDPDPIPEPPA